ncbi:hypothetical protein ERJ75_000337700 [Trypanosoma vivax]|nr:hypothetical protein ERJ75_000337700 [Trypanosoma vivax]
MRARGDKRGCGPTPHKVRRVISQEAAVHVRRRCDNIAGRPRARPRGRRSWAGSRQRAKGDGTQGASGRSARHATGRRRTARGGTHEVGARTEDVFHVLGLWTEAPTRGRSRSHTRTQHAARALRRGCCLELGWGSSAIIGHRDSGKRPQHAAQTTPTGPALHGEQGCNGRTGDKRQRRKTTGAGLRRKRRKKHAGEDDTGRRGTRHAPQLVQRTPRGGGWLRVSGRERLASRATRRGLRGQVAWRTRDYSA